MEQKNLQLNMIALDQCPTCKIITRKQFIKLHIANDCDDEKAAKANVALIVESMNQHN